MKSVVCLPASLHPFAPNGGDWSALALMENQIAGAARIVLAFRDDENGHALEEEIARRIGRERCHRTRWHNVPVPQQLTGAWSVLQYHGAEALRSEIQAAQPYPVAGVHELVDVEDRLDVIYEFGLQRGESTDWPTLDVHYTVKPGQMTIVTGIPGHGKSNVLDALCVNLARVHGWVFGMFSPENQPIERHYASLMEKYVGAPFDTGPSRRITVEQKNEAKRWLQEHFKMILPDEQEGNWTVDGVLSLAKMLVYRHGIRGIVMDPWNELDHTRPPGMSETDHISACLTKIRRFARLNGVHVWIVAHPTKLEPKADGEYPVPTPYMIAGGAHWRNKADNCLTIHRNVGKEDEDVVDVHIQKIRFKEIGRVGRISLRYDHVCGRYVDDIDQQKRELALKKGVSLPSRDIRIPHPRTFTPLSAAGADEEEFAVF